MEIVLIILAFVLLVGGILGAVIPALPGPPLSYIGLLLIQWSGHLGARDRYFSLFILLIWAGITVAVTIVDYFLPALMAKRFGGSRAAIIGSFLGLLAGLFIFPPWGMIAGPFLGALVGELIHNRGEDAKEALRVALGAFLAFIVGSGAKLIVSSLMLFYAVRAIF